MPQPIPDAPPDVAAALDQLAEDLATEAGSNLAGLILYGGLARGRYRPGRSDVNVVVLLHDASAEALAAAGGPSAALRSSRRRRRPSASTARRWSAWTRCARTMPCPARWRACTLACWRPSRGRSRSPIGWGRLRREPARPGRTAVPDLLRAGVRGRVRPGHRPALAAERASGRAAA